ncbi:hypothetical protein FO519_009363 [Halicephalobus sp. NKZ332]|nr:hypothetical protein FO519_009363 [Halicephalobus sp. NKZ332]
MKVFVLLIFLVFVKGEEIRQCTCDELDSCKDSIFQKVTPCVTQCKTQSSDNSSSSIDPEVILNCIKQSRNQNGSCFSILRNQVCANNPETKIDSSDTFTGGNQGVVGKILQNRVQKALSEGTSTISQFISSSLGVDAKTFGDCMKTCVQESNPLGCIENIGCGLKKPSTFNLLTILPTCKSRKAQAKQQICQCIKDAGYNNDQC